MATVDPADLMSITQPRLAEARLTTQRRQPNIGQDLNPLTNRIVYELVDVSTLVPDPKPDPWGCLACGSRKLAHSRI